MSSKIYWLIIGAATFWVPAIYASHFLPQLNVVMLNAIPLACMILLGIICRLLNRSPRWALVLAGIYVLGPVLQLAPSMFTHASPLPSAIHEKMWLLALCLFPPVTLWLALLNGLLYSLLIGTAALTAMAFGQMPRSAEV